MDELALVLDHNASAVSFEPDNRKFLRVIRALPGTPLFMHGEGSRLIGATDEERNVLKTTIADWISQLRAIHFRIPTLCPVKLFADVAEFHAQPFKFCTGWTEKADEKIQLLVVDRTTREYRIHLIHGDLLPHNILTDHPRIPPDGAR
ncbi:hypothetical protein C8J57DRAFT_1525312 [Mycena rebaudengoi]|nr:hypothetical protein C8J57DRAFT_1525312 [Mycena rebaudengoi]